jgi:hypothetical protein
MPVRSPSHALLCLVALSALVALLAAACDNAPLHSLATPAVRHSPQRSPAAQPPPAVTPPKHTGTSTAVPKSSDATRALPPGPSMPSDDWVHDCGTQLLALDENDMIWDVLEIKGALTVVADSAVYRQSDDGSFSVWDSTQSPFWVVTDGATLFASRFDYFGTQLDQIDRTDGPGTHQVLFNADDAEPIVAAVAVPEPDAIERHAAFLHIALAGDDVYVEAELWSSFGDGTATYDAFLLSVNKAGGAPVVRAHLDNEVNAIAASSDGSAIFIAGTGIEKFDVAGGTLSPWFDAATSPHDGSVNATDVEALALPMTLAVAGDDLFFSEGSPVARISSSGTWHAYDHLQPRVSESPIDVSSRYVYWPRVSGMPDDYGEGVIMRASRYGEIAVPEVANDCVPLPQAAYVHGSSLDIVQWIPPTLYRVPLHE